ncbi:dCMP deaminase [Sphingopyxis sp. Root214]|uniref:nucleoside deaminase n=1 Tax=unclassified Sphingopyxis TaxID=2614943 RepID=UPI0007003A8F|nr:MULTISPECIES: nucleoside deaminase [unclassified Sphingopyxis]KQZ77286.1 dCMP deaminase [Sphingopyxis sp. Root154]KRC08827.1 dCMP deaminase [Sphingopyxis sp. Root214]
MEDSEEYLREAIALAYANAEKGGRPFGAVIVRDGRIVAKAVNEISETSDPTSHAELNAIRLASKSLGADLSGCAVFASGHPCPMCMAAMRLTGINAVTYAYSNEDGAPHGLSTAAIYDDLAKPFSQQAMEIRHLPVRLAGRPDLYAGWRQRQG